MSEPGLPFVRALVDARSSLGEQLLENLGTPLGAYLVSLLPPERPANPHRDRFARAVAADHERHGGVAGDDLGDHLLRHPVVQQADHSNLLLDPETFLNNFLFAVACRDGGIGTMVVSQCSTVSCLSRRDPVAGPPFLRTRHSLYRVLPFSKSTFKSSTFCALPGPVRITLDRLDGPGPEAEADPVLRGMLHRTWPDAPTAYRDCNDELWSVLGASTGVSRVGIDERATATCVADHLGDPTSPIHQLVFVPRLRRTFLEVKRELVASPSNLAVNLATPDFFWYRHGTRLQPTVLAGDDASPRWTREPSGRAVPVEWDPQSVSQAVRDEIVYPDRILAYLARCILPRVTAIGGTSQQDYVRLYRQMILETHRREPFLDQHDRESVDDESTSLLGGAPLIERVGETAELLEDLGPGCDLGGFERRMTNQPLGRTIGTLSCADYLRPRLTTQEAI